MHGSSILRLSREEQHEPKARAVHESTLPQLEECRLSRVFNSTSSWKIVGILMPAIGLSLLLGPALTFLPEQLAIKSEHMVSDLLQFLPLDLEKLVTILHLCEPEDCWK